MPASPDWPIRGGFLISSWVCSFPLAAMTTATFVMTKRSGLEFFVWLGGLLLAIATLVVVVLVGKTLSAVGRQSICVPE